MRNGTRPARHIGRERRFHDHFGALSTAVIPDFSLDTGVNGMPDQEKEEAFTECVGYTVSDILSDVLKTPLSPDFSYAGALFVTGEPSTTSGASFHGGMQGGVALGALPKILAPFTSKDKGQQYVATWANWEAKLRTAANEYVQNGIMNVLGNGDAFDSILAALYVGKIGVCIGTPWFDEWSTGIQSGVVQLPQLDGNYPSWHCWAIKGKKTINGVPYLIGKVWLGERIGDRGWLYFSREAINAALTVPGTGALTFNPLAVRWVSLVGILLQRFPALLPYLPQLLKLKI